jgi:hypothetical protein
MFITKKKFENAIHEAKHEVAEQWERKLQEIEERRWRDEDNRQRADYYDRRFIDLEKRVLALEKETGLVIEAHCCHCNNAVPPARF